MVKLTLTPKSHRLLKRLSQELSTKDFVVRRITPCVREILEWCYARDLIPEGEMQGTQFYFRSELLNNINVCLLEEGGITTTCTIAPDSLSQARHGQFEYKSVREGPRKNRVLLAMPNNGQFCCTGIKDINDCYVDVDVKQIELSQFHEVIVVENLDSFYNLTFYSLPTHARSLFIYRGDSLYGGGRAMLTQEASARGMPIRLFCDLDLKSMHEAVTGLYTHIAAPSIHTFKDKAHPGQWRPEQLKYSTVVPPLELEPYFNFAKDFNRALLQQWMQGVALDWVPLK